MRPSRPSTDRADARGLADDEGSASVEFLTVGLLLLVPLVYLVLTLAQLQAAAFAVEGAARHASRVFVQSESLGSASAATERAIAVTLADYGLADAAPTVELSCRPEPDDCLTRRGFVTVQVTVEVTLPLLPPALELALPTTVPISASSTEQVSRFWGAE